MSILFLNRVYPPADGATGQLLAELAPALARRGHRVTVVTGPAGETISSPVAIEGVRVERVRGLPFTRASHWRRALSYLSLYPALLWRALQLPRADVVVTLTDPPLLLVLGVILKTLKGSRHFHWAQDIYPELAEEMGVLPRGGMIAGALRWISSASLRHSDRIIAVGRCMKSRLVRRGLDPARIEIIPNWGHGDRPLLNEATIDAFRGEHDLRGRFVVMYSGNLGLAHPFEAMLDAAERLRVSHPSVLFLFVGGGPRLPWVRDQAARRGLENVRFLPFQPRERLAQSLAAADVHLASMLNELCGLVVPSKVYGVMSSGRPCVFLGPDESEAAQFILQNRCGSVLPQATGARLASCLAQWADDASLMRETCARVGEIAGRVSLSAAVVAFVRAIAEPGEFTALPTLDDRGEESGHLEAAVQSSRVSS